MIKRIAVHIYTFLAVNQKNKKIILLARGWFLNDEFFLKIENLKNIFNFRTEMDAIAWLKSYAEDILTEKAAK